MGTKNESKSDIKQDGAKPVVENANPAAIDKAPEVIKSGVIEHGQGMSMELSEAANGLPEGHVLHWHTELAAPVEAVETEEVKTGDKGDQNIEQE